VGLDLTVAAVTVTVIIIMIMIIIIIIIIIIVIVIIIIVIRSFFIPSGLSFKIVSLPLSRVPLSNADVSFGLESLPLCSL
jgi:hypothetical protein